MSSPRRYFDVFGLKPSFHINQDDLKTRLFELSKKYHPDRMSLSDHIQDDTTIEEINKAYNILRNDFSRAKYLHGSNTSSVDKEFLMDMLDYEELISSINNNDDERGIRDDLDKKISECKQNHSNNEYLVKWGYYERLKKILDKRDH